MLLQVDQQTWTALGLGGTEAHVAIAASGLLGGILLAWKEDLFDRSCTWTGCHVVAARLVNRRHGFNAVIASVYGPATAILRSELWEDLTRLHGDFLESPILISGDFNVTLMASERPNDGGGRDRSHANFVMSSQSWAWQRWDPQIGGLHGKERPLSLDWTDSSAPRTS